MSLDAECIDLCVALNGLDGIETFESCCGHGKNYFVIWFFAHEQKYLPLILHIVDGFNWHCEVRTNYDVSNMYYLIESNSKGKKSYKEARKIADKLKGIINQPSARG